ncbi:GGDEF domain-containing protein [Luteimonas sp. TWI1416]|uniref:tetratricopeptide repeat-containing diguanylate cyclase n=1 Tax=unclassified Luteimonas TaxID=2629088 RepID=UPI0032097DD3
MTATGAMTMIRANAPREAVAGDARDVRSRARWRLGLLLVGIVLSQVALAGDALDALIEEASALRTSDPQRVDALLRDMAGHLETATEAQRARVQLLRVHRMMTSGQSAIATDQLTALLASTADPVARFETASMLANIYAVQRRFEDALRMLETMLPLADQVEDAQLRHRGLMVAAIVYNQVGEFGQAQQYAERVLREDPDGRNACAAGGVLLEAINGLGQSFTDAAGQSALDRCTAQGEPIFAGFVRLHIARQWDTRGRWEEALALLGGGLAAVERTGYPFLIAQTRAALAALSQRAGQPAAARAHAEAALANSQDATSTEARVTAHRVQYELALAKGDAVAALAAYRQYVDAERAHFNDVKTREMAYQVVRHQSLQQAQQIELLRQKNQLLELERSVTEQRARSWLLLTLVLVGLVASVGYWAYKTKRLQMRLKRMTEVDALTGISNRQHFSERAEAALAQCARERMPAVLVMFDLDHFKLVNDRHGHAAGDWALQQVAVRVQPLCREIDSFGRLGGEEFALLLPGLDESAGRRLAGDAQARLAGVDTQAQGYGFRIAASFGVASAITGGYSLAALMRQADQAMYAAKRNGRRQVRVFDPHAQGDDPEASQALRGRGHEVAAAPAHAGDPTRRAIA